MSLSIPLSASSVLNMLSGTNKNQTISAVYGVLTGVLYVVFAFGITREDYTYLLLIYTSLFFLFYKTVNAEHISYATLVKVSFVFRFLLLLAIPNLSQDFYRFIWDGRMSLQGINPYLQTPISFIQDRVFLIAQAQELYDGMGNLSAMHYTNYPPLNQLCFAIAALFAGKSILGSAVVLRLIIITADFGIYYYGKKLLEKLKLPVHRIFWYLLNPFIILELTGNLHFEGVMIFFLIWSLYQLSNGNWEKSAFLIALSISIKLIPLMLLPLFYRMLGIKRLIVYSLIVGAVSIALFAPFISPVFIRNYAETVGLWFQNFEFNASIYYVAREIGFQIRGCNEIAIIGKVIPIVVVLFIVGLAFIRRNIPLQHLISGMLLALTFYFFTATTVHPWYIATLVVLSLFTAYKYPLVWSFVIILSYLTYAYSSTDQNLWILLLEYGVVYGYLIYEVSSRKQRLVKDPKST